MQSLVCVHAWYLYILSGVPNCLLFFVIMSRRLRSNVPPAASWPSPLRPCGNTPPLIKVASVEIAIFDHFDVLGTKEMLFPPSGGLDSFKAALSVKISTLLDGRFFSPFPPWRNYCSKGLLASGELHCRTPDICCVPLAHSAKRLPLKINFISCCLERVFLFLHPTAHHQRCAMAAGGPMAPLQLLLPWDSLLVLLAGAEQQCGCQTDLDQLLSLRVSGLHLQFPQFAWQISETSFLSPQDVAHTETFLVIVTKEADPSPFW